MELLIQLFGDLLTFVYHCFDRIVIHGYLSGLSRPEKVVHFAHHVLGIPVVSKEVLSRRTDDYRDWVEAFARNHKIPMEWAGKGLRKEDHALPALRHMEKAGAYVVYFIFKSMEQGRTFRITVLKYPWPIGLLSTSAQTICSGSAADHFERSNEAFAISCCTIGSTELSVTVEPRCFMRCFD